MNFENPNNKLSLANKSLIKLSALQCIGLFVLSILALSFWGCATDGDKSKTDENQEQLSSDTSTLDKPRVAKVMIKKRIDEGVNNILLNLEFPHNFNNTMISITLMSNSETLNSTINIDTTCHSSKVILGTLPDTTINSIDSGTIYTANLIGNSISDSDATVSISDTTNIICL